MIMRELGAWGYDTGDMGNQGYQGRIEQDAKWPWIEIEKPNEPESRLWKLEFYLSAKSRILTWPGRLEF